VTIRLSSANERWEFDALESNLVVEIVVVDGDAESELKNAAAMVGHDRFSARVFKTQDSDNA
jgi:ABC-type uncharacterized transport system substrate-binding protein